MVDGRVADFWYPGHGGTCWHNIRKFVQDRTFSGFLLFLEILLIIVAKDDKLDQFSPLLWADQAQVCFGTLTSQVHVTRPFHNWKFKYNLKL